MKPRDPTQAARLAPNSSNVLETLEAALSLLETFEDINSAALAAGIAPSPDDWSKLNLCALELRKWVDRLSELETPEETELTRKIDRFKDSDGTPSSKVYKWVPK